MTQCAPHRHLGSAGGRLLGQQDHLERPLGQVLAGQENLRARLEEGLDAHRPQRVGAAAQRPQRMGGGAGEGPPLETDPP